MPKGYVYILKCSDGTYYTGSTVDIEKRIAQHKDGNGANHTKKRLPIELVYLEEFQRIDLAFIREKQIQKWRREKKEALINDNKYKLPKLDIAYRDKVASRTSATKTKPLNDKTLPEALEGNTKKTFYSHGKLLLTGEYLVLDGALSLAIPTRFGQELKVQENDSGKLEWSSFDENGNIWFESTFLIQNNEIKQSVASDNPIAKRLLQILNTAKTLNQDFFNNCKGYKVTTQLEFPKNWGLGTSSTLINNIANWAHVNPYQLLENTFGGSGYDIACAEANGSITFQLDQQDISRATGNDKQHIIEITDFDPSFKNNLYFVHLNQKKNSREGIAQYRANPSDLNEDIKKVNQITKAFINCDELNDFQELIHRHETIISNIISQKPIKETLFKDFDGSIKSLGAWGGDFVLVASDQNPSSYFMNKGYSTILKYDEMIFQ